MTDASIETGGTDRLTLARDALRVSKPVPPGVNAGVTAAGWMAALAGFIALAALMLVIMLPRGGAAATGPSGALALREDAGAPVMDTPFLGSITLEAPAPDMAPDAAPLRVDDGFNAAAPRPMVAVVIDDVGVDQAMSARALALPSPVTISVLPYASRAAGVATEASALGHEVFVHLPMEPVGLADPGPGALTTWHGAEAVAERTRQALAQVPYATGLNNHMGSRFTACVPCVEPVVEAAADAGFTVLDSVTSDKSALGAAAARAGVATLARDVFLDHDPDPAAMRGQLDRAERIARQRGVAVVIAHPKAASLEVLASWMVDAEARGFDVGRVRDALARQRLTVAQR